MLNADLGLNLLLRGGAMGTLVLIAAVLWRDRSSSIAMRLGALFSVSMAAVTLASIPGFGEVPPSWRLFVAGLASGSMFLFWLFTRALFDDTFALTRVHTLMWLGLAFLGIVNCAVGPFSMPAPWVAALRLMLGVSPVAWALLSIVHSLASWREDLIERRRQLRTLIVAITALYTVAQLLVALLSGLSLRAVVESTANAGGIAVLTLFVAWRLLRPGHDGLFEVSVPAGATTGAHRYNPVEHAETARDPLESILTPLDMQHIEALDALMTVDHLYREPSQSIGVLAERMGLPEHKLRRLINQGLGHRNFSAFLNTYRLADARRWLTDPTQRDTPILTIAMDAGFQSIGPFNRAFKADTGMTPSEFRRLGSQVPSPVPGANLA
ncbi:MAG: helix-turn-helix domain-containing protein [Variovorax sp.]